MSSYSTVYQPSDDTFILLDSLEAALNDETKDSPKLILELCVGSGYVSSKIAARLKSSFLICTDINYEACDCTLKEMSKVTSLFDIILGDCVMCFHDRLKGCFDLIYCNPPYVETSSTELVDGDMKSKAWAGGKRGREVIDKILRYSICFLSDHGAYYMVLIKENDPHEICDALRKCGYKVEIVMIRQLNDFLYVIEIKRSTKTT